MESLRKDKILKYNEDTLAMVRKTVNLDEPGVMDEAVNILERWVKEQNHFTRNTFDRRYLETMIIASKGSLERAKTRLDRTCTFRTLKPDLFENIDIRHIYKTSLKHVSQGLLPKMTKNYERVYLYKNVGSKFESHIMKDFTCVAVYFAEYLRLNDYAAGYYVVMDFTDANLADLLPKITLSDFQELIAYVLDCCGFRLKAAYLISTSKFIEVGIALAKKVLSAKIAGRLHVLISKESVKNFIEADILPKEYGGNERSIEELREQWLDAMTAEDFTEYLKGMNTARTNESLRQKDVFNDQYMGMPGTFRMLSVD